MAAHDSTSQADAMASARAYVRAWRERDEGLERIRLRDLRALTEVQAAQRFAMLSCSAVPLPTRTTSGLVEQQRILSRLRSAP